MAKHDGLFNTVPLGTMDVGNMVERFRKHKEVLAIAGPPGIGKTAGIYYRLKKIAEKAGMIYNANPKPSDWKKPNYFNVLTLMTSAMLEEDAKGIPVKSKLEDGTEITIYLKSESWPQEGVGAIVYDEFANGKSAVLNALQQVILEGVAGNFKLSPDVQQIIITNRDCDNTGTNRIPSALRNRAAWFEVLPPNKPEEWVNEMAKVGVYVDNSLAAFLISIGDKYLYNFDPDQEQYGYGTPRSIVKASNIIRDVTDINEKSKLVGGFMGLDAGRDFKTFLELTSKIDMEGLIKDAKLIHEYEDNVGKMYAIFVSLSERVSSNKKLMPNIMNILEETNRPEYGSFLMKNLLDKFGDNKLVEMIVSCDNFKKITDRYSALLSRKED